MKKFIRLTQPSSPVQESQSLEIPPYLPPIVKDVADSLLIRDPESAQRYLEAHISQKGRTKKDESNFDSIGDN